MLSNEEVQAAVEYGHETASLEFKRADTLKSKSYVAMVARAAMALANSRDGGHILLGIDEKDPSGPSSGVTAPQLAEWLNHDDVMAKLNTYADPPLSLHSEARLLRSGKPIVVIEVGEFDSIPILCNRDFPEKLILGELYTRSMAKPESTRHLTQNELRVVLDLATQKQLRQFIATARGASVDIGLPLDRDSYANQYRSLGPVDRPQAAQLIVRVHPMKFTKNRLPYKDLNMLAAASYVTGNGWALPETLGGNQRGDDWVGSTSEWRLFQSGLFVLNCLFPEGVSADFDGIEDVTDDAAGYVPVWWLTAQITLATELAARFQRSAFPDVPLQLELEILGAEGQQIVVGNARRSGFHRSYRLGVDPWRREVTITPEVALSGGRNEANKLVVDLLQRFGWVGVTSEIVEDMQNETLGRRR